MSIPEGCTERGNALPPPKKKRRTAWKGRSHRALCEQFFNYKEFNGPDKHVTAMFYGDCTLLVDLGDFKAGNKFDEITVSLERSDMKLYQKGCNRPVATFRLQLLAKRPKEK